MRRLTYTNHHWAKQKTHTGNLKISKIWIGVLCLMIVSFISQFIVSNILALRGEEVVKSSDKITLILRENQQTREELATKMSITKISDNAQNLGLTVASTLKYYDLSQPVAVLPQ